MTIVKTPVAVGASDGLSIRASMHPLGGSSILSITAPAREFGYSALC
jgi:hypothetical protein